MKCHGFYFDVHLLIERMRADGTQGA
jgi:hypothetical protein